ncbi:hypothetical protein TUZN_0142 [Thermoproteus uzoniensis 768-20]|uniref:Uncharacterized protein n=1 Tax=Thermoproteus uzoniensis (strain 768-20) TaxID=999630 RepID=F2L1H2_THEU7|nr:hypothetical protein [Thermoproteus uzoniensis]AEA11642.1 hypothetical protein TUZN_0142 [Thermoproteus uzoniensis 768-20]
MTPEQGRAGYALAVIILILALFALPFSSGASLYVDLMVIVIDLAFLAYVVFSVRRSLKSA